jgi:quinol monooxygenase YgiN
MSVQVIVELDVKESQINKIQSLFSDLLQQTRARSGNEGVKVLYESKANTKIVLIEQWKSFDDYEKYNKWREQQGDLAMLGTMLVSPPIRRYLEFMKV